MTARLSIGLQTTPVIYASLTSLVELMAKVQRSHVVLQRSRRDIRRPAAPWPHASRGGLQAIQLLAACVQGLTWNQTPAWPTFFIMVELLTVYLSRGILLLVILRHGFTHLWLVQRETTKRETSLVWWCCIRWFEWRKIRLIFSLQLYELNHFAHSDDCREK